MFNIAVQAGYELFEAQFSPRRTLQLWLGSRAHFRQCFIRLLVY